jgi:hypothetical protein
MAPPSLATRSIAFFGAALLLFSSGCRRAPSAGDSLDAGAPIAAESSQPPADPAEVGAASAPDAGKIMEPWSREKEIARRHPTLDGTKIAYQDGNYGLWVSAADGSGAKRVLDARTARIENPPQVALPLSECDLLTILRWAPDASKIYFVAGGWGNTSALYRLDLAKGTVRFLHTASALGVVERCSDPHQVGRVLVFEHTYYGPVHPIGDEWILLDDGGKLLGEIGPGDANLDRFLARVCGIGDAPPDPRDEVPAKLKAAPFRCAKHNVRYEPRHFLDRTEYPLFRWDLVGPKGPDDDATYIASGDVTVGVVNRDCPEVLR